MAIKYHSSTGFEFEHDTKDYGKDCAKHNCSGNGAEQKVICQQVCLGALWCVVFFSNIFLSFIYSNHFILVRATVGPEPIWELWAQGEFTLNEMAVTMDHTHTFTHSFIPTDSLA